jgi:citrate synthase
MMVWHEGINLYQYNQYMSEWVDRAAALATLKVRPQTLYAYVSRGRIGMRPDPDDPRRSLYRADDIAALVERRTRGRRPSDIAASAFAWGEPAIATAISTIRRGRLIYRGKDAVELARTATAEQAAALLWQSEAVSFPAERTGKVADNPFLALAALAGSDDAMLGRSADRWRADASTCIAALAVSLGAATGAGALHERLAAGWSADTAAVQTVRKALVLMADHELNASAFATRVAASTGASMAASLLAGLCTLSGPRHGGAGEALLGLLAEADRLGVGKAIAGWLARDHYLPGFGHPLYPNGDPRAAALLEDLPIDRALMELQNAVLAATGLPPNIDFALAALARAHSLGEDAPFRLFALGRAIGWAAHAMEQVAQGGLIRPRARYQGDEPPPSS